MLDLGTVTWNSKSRFLFHGLQEFVELAILASYSRVHPVLAITALPGFRRLNRATALLDVSQSVRNRAKPYGRYPSGTGILTRFPFTLLLLRKGLGSANPQLTNIDEEPEPLRR